ncbi:universal stress protein UspA [Thermosediminibacter litoriperuensis]|uniref:Two-component system sensor histidine kinase KdpD n=1 Tax=Thermosediminibacter litoriperuensis TaxID=291989 RepID=A0A5S5AK66_9FIRM|nr:universal stress protein UspA [Thermosediminibacter litoriperuensis]TYP51313.1 two-component system sensor histidine kinase KdpD [Thermosediminibacter litoriperuensis]
MMTIFDPSVQHRIMVCVTPQKSCERLIQRGAARASELGGEFCVVYVNKSQDLGRDLKEHKILLELFEMAKGLGGTVSILAGNKVYHTLAEYARNNRITHIIVGKSLRSAFDAQKNGEVINPLIRAVEKNGILVEVVE